MDAPRAAGLARGPDHARCRRLRQLGKRRPDRRQRAHESARPQQLPAGAPAYRQIAVKPLLIDLVHVQQAIGAARRDGAVLDVLADDPGAFFVAAAEQIAAIVIMQSAVMLVPGFVIVVVRHCPPLGAN